MRGDPKIVRVPESQVIGANLEGSGPIKSPDWRMSSLCAS